MASKVSTMNNSILLPLRHRHRPRTSVSSLAAVAAPRRLAPIVAPEQACPVEPKPSLANSWREIQGSANWDHLVEPLNPLLRDEIVRYGEFILACYKAFDLDPTSNCYLNCKYSKNNILKETDSTSLSYEVTKYIYATPDSKNPARWIGYVAVSTDREVARLGRRDIVVSFRGTVTAAEWKANFMSSLTPARLDPNELRPEVKVLSGFLNLYTSESSCKFNHGSCRQQLLSEISRIINKYKDSDTELSITLAGHSMGSSLALLLGYDLAEVGLNREVPITVYSFGGPRVGNSGFKERCEKLGVKVLRVVNVNDPVTKMPGVLLNENFRVLAERYELPWSCACYAHVGVELALECCFNLTNPVCVHDLDAYLGLLKRPAAKMVKGSDLMNSVIKLFFAQMRFHAAERSVKKLVQSLRSCDLTPWFQSR